jgi:hypothetical protein
LPLWLLAGFPEVADWLDDELSRLVSVSTDPATRDRAVAGLFGAEPDADSAFGEDTMGNGLDKLRARHCRSLVNTYVNRTGRALEVAVLKGSANDLYSASQVYSAMGEESNFTLIAGVTTQYYAELKRTYGTALPDETSVLALSGILPAGAYIQAGEVTTDQIVELAQSSEGARDRLVAFLIPFEALLLTVDRPQLSPEHILEECHNQADAIQSSVARAMRAYTGEAMVAAAVNAVMSWPKWEHIRRAVGL